MIATPLRHSRAVSLRRAAFCPLIPLLAALLATTVTVKRVPGGQVVGTCDRPSRKSSISGPVEVRGHVVVRAFGRPGQYAAVEGARLEWLDGAGRLRGRAISQSGGRFSAYLIPGQYSVRVSAPQRYQDRSLSMAVRPGMAPPRIELARAPVRTGPSVSRAEPPSAPRLEVRVSDAGGEFGPVPLSGAAVTLSRKGRKVAACRTDSAGVYAAAVEPESPCQVSVSCSGYRSASKTVSVSAHTRTDVVLQHATHAGSRSPSRAAKPDPRADPRRKAKDSAHRQSTAKQVTVPF